jgi:hypothetical protein
MAGIRNAAEKIIRGLDRMQELRAPASFFIQKNRPKGERYAENPKVQHEKPVRVSPDPKAACRQNI